MGGPASFDRAGFLGEFPRMTPDGVLTNSADFGWLGGSLTWKIPFGWQKRDSIGSEDDEIAKFAEDTRQNFRIETNGDFRVDKLGHWVERKIDGRVFLDGHLE